MRSITLSQTFSRKRSLCVALEEPSDVSSKIDPLELYQLTHSASSNRAHIMDTLRKDSLDANAPRQAFRSDHGKVGVIGSSVGIVALVLTGLATFGVVGYPEVGSLPHSPL
jgi:hypothetical protein